MPVIIPSSDALDLAEVAIQARRLAEALDRIAKHGGPTPPDLRDAPLVEAWRPVGRLAPALSGNVHGHPVLRSSRPKVTSELFAFDPLAGWARTWSRWYRLGDPADLHFGAKH